MQSSKIKKILVIGGLGYIGGALIRAMEEKGIQYTSVDRRESENTKHRVLDLRDTEATRVLLQEQMPNVVVHAGTHSALAYRDNFRESFEDDYLSLQSLLSAITEPETRVLYFSSNYVYSGYPSSEEVTEVHRLLPTHNFGVGKSFFEQYLMRNHRETVVFRLSSVFGKGATQHPNALSNLVDNARESGQVTVWGTGARMMQYVYLPDVVRFVIAAFSIQPGLYNLGGNEYISVADSAKMLARHFDAETMFLKDKREGETLPFISTRALRSEVPHERFTPFTEAMKEFLSLLP